MLIPQELQLSHYNPLLTLEYNNKYFQDDVKS